MNHNPETQPLDPFARFASIFRRDIPAMQPDARVERVNDVLSTLISLPLAILGIVWLARVSDWTLIWQNWPALALVIALILLLNRWNFFLITDLGVRGGGTYGNASSTLDSVARWSAVFLFGPTVLWVVVSLEIGMLLVRLLRTPWRNPLDRNWSILQNVVMTVAGLTLLPLLAFSAYTAWGGTYPISGLTLRNFVLGAGAMGIQFLLEAIFVWVAYLGYKLVFTLWQERANVTRAMLTSIVRLYFVSVLIPGLGNLFAPLLAGAYVEHGLFIYFMFNLALLAMAWLAHQMSQAIEQSRAQTSQIGKLEALGRAILNAPPDNNSLPDLLTEHAASMFTYARLAIWLEPGEILLKKPDGWQEDADLQSLRSWLAANPQAIAVNKGDSAPWQPADAEKKFRPSLLVPILDVESGEAIGGIYLELHLLGQSYSRAALNLILPTLQSLAAQVASALHQKVIYARSLAHQKTQNELEFARRIQTGFLPDVLPEIPGWQLSASLEPAREMSGDFYDVISLPSGKIGLLIADVADKGVGPALYMALSRTLIRTFAMQFENQPEQVFQTTNERILQDALESMFVTVFYAVLDPRAATLTYANAGHNPPLVLRAKDISNPELLSRTGTALGVMEDLTWGAKTIPLARGDLLVLYTDGVTEAQDAADSLFGDDRLLDVVRAHAGENAPEIQAAILESIRAFVGDAPQFDDITLMTLKRE
jgi:serine phosphatase RsbU (regulator of sigma subunit)